MCLSFTSRARALEAANKPTTTHPTRSTCNGHGHCPFPCPILLRLQRLTNSLVLFEKNSATSKFFITIDEESRQQGYQAVFDILLRRSAYPAAPLTSLCVCATTNERAVSLRCATPFALAAEESFLLTKNFRHHGDR